MVFIEPFTGDADAIIIVTGVDALLLGVLFPSSFARALAAATARIPAAAKDDAPPNPPIPPPLALPLPMPLPMLPMPPAPVDRALRLEDGRLDEGPLPPACCW